jgi:DNA-binding transcriptional MerR regulator
MKSKIPDKEYFRIGEVAKLLEVEPHVVRYWESEFRLVKPLRAESRQRLYRRKDIETLFRIKRLLYEERYTIAGAKQRLRESTDDDSAKELLQEVVDELKDLRKRLD